MGRELCFIILCLMACAAGTTSAVPIFSFTDFSSTSGVVLAGNAIQSGNQIQLTPPSTLKAGALWVSTPYDVTHSFQFSMTFTVDSPSETGTNGADGFALVVQNDPRPLGSVIGSNGGGLGWYGTGNAVQNTVAATLRTYKANPESLIGYNGNSTDNGFIIPVNGQSGTVGLLLGSTRTLEERYDANTQSMTVLLDGHSIGLDNVPLGDQLSHLIGGNVAYFGVTAGTGQSFSRQSVSSLTLTGDVPEPNAEFAVIVGLILLMSGRPRLCVKF